jgi:hypothetical protein
VPGDLGVAREVPEDALRGLAHGDPGIVVAELEPGAQVCEQHLVVREHDVLFAAELAEEGAARDPGGPRDLLDGRRFEPLLCEEFEGRGDDDGARGGRGRCLAHVE